MKKRELIIISLSFILFFFLSGITVFGQAEKKEIREGNKLFKSEKFEESEVSYRKAIEIESNSVPGSFNLGDALYRQEKFEDASEQFNFVVNNNVDKQTKSQAFHNLGNSLLQEGKLEEAIDAYKNALRNVPGDMDTKYNLAYAQNLLKQQQEQQQNQDQDQENQENQEKENQDQQNQEQQNQDQQNQDQQNQDQQNQDQQNQDQQEQEQQDQEQQDQQAQPQEGKISKEDAQRLLDALANDEKKLQEKVKKEKAKAKRVRVLKDW